MKKEIHTIITTAANSYMGFFQDPTACGTFFSLARAQERFGALIAKEMETLNSRFDTEEVAEGLWTMYEDGSASACFVRIEILSSEIEDWNAVETEGVQL